MDRIPFYRRIPIALVIWAALVVALTLFMASTKPMAVLNTVNKLHVLLAAGVIGWWLDHVVLFPYARPASYLLHDWRGGPQPDTLQAPAHADYPVIGGYQLLFAVACVRRALLVGLIMLAAALVI